MGTLCGTCCLGHLRPVLDCDGFGQAYFGHPQVIKHLIEFRADVDTIDAYGGTPLVAAALNGALDCVRVLTAAGADVNHTTNNLNTPLMKAAINGCAAASSLALPLSSAWMHR